MSGVERKAGLNPVVIDVKFLSLAVDLLLIKETIHLGREGIINI